VTGVRATSEGAEIEIRADLVVAADGRHSTLRERAGFAVENLGAPMDVLWMRISRHSDDPADAFGHIEAGRFFIMLNRDDYWQCAFVIPKGSADTLNKRPIAEFRRIILELSPWLDNRVDEIRSWDDVKLLTVAVDRLPQWYRPGLLCIGDAAHAIQSRGPGCGGGGQHIVPAAPRPRGDDRGPAQGRGAARMADPGDAVHANCRPESCDQPGARQHAAAEAAVRGEGHPMVPGVAAHRRAGDRHRRAPGAYSHAGRSVTARRGTLMREVVWRSTNLRGHSGAG